MFSDNFVRQRSLSNGVHYSASVVRPQAAGSTHEGVHMHVPAPPSRASSSSQSYTHSPPINNAKPSMKPLSSLSCKSRSNLSQFRQQSLPPRLTKSKSITSPGYSSQTHSSSYKARQNVKLMSGPSLTSLHLRREQLHRQQSIPSKSSPNQPLLEKRHAITSQKCVRASVQQVPLFCESPLHTDVHLVGGTRKAVCSGGMEITQVNFELDKLPLVESRRSSVSLPCSALELEETNQSSESGSHHQRKKSRDLKSQPKRKRMSIEVHLPSSSSKDGNKFKGHSDSNGFSTKATKHSNTEIKRHLSLTEKRQSRASMSLDYSSACKKRDGSVKRYALGSKQTDSLAGATYEGMFMSVYRMYCAYTCMY